MQNNHVTRLFETRSRFSGELQSDLVTVLGLGNILLSDEGFGVHAVTALRQQYVFSPSIDIIDGGTMGLDLLPLFQDRNRILIIDAVDFGKHPGHIGTLEGDAIRSVLNPKLSVHHIGLADLLLTAKLTRETPLELCLLGIQPDSLETGLVLSGQISRSVDTVITMAIRRLQEWQIKVSSVNELAAR